MMVPGRVVGDLLVGAEVQEIKPYHYFNTTPPLTLPAPPNKNPKVLK